MRLLFVVLPLLFILESCASYATRFDEAPTCKTTLEGKYIKKPNYYRNCSCLFVKYKEAFKVVEGNIVDIDKNGILFDPQREGILSNPDPQYFQYDKLVCAVDTTGCAFYGSIPKRFAIDFNLIVDLECLDNPDKIVYPMELIPNESFSFCLDPGEYRINTLQFEYKDIFHTVIDFPIVKFKIMEGKANYLGNILVDINNDLDNNIILPCKTGDNRSNISAFYLGGIIGAAINNIAQDMADADLFHTLYIDLDKNFISISGLPIETSKITVDYNKSK